MRISSLRTRLFVSTLLCALVIPAAAPAAVITVISHDGVNEGLNDPSPRAPIGGNPGTTLGAQRLNALQFAADIWSTYLTSSVPIQVGATFDSQSCSGFAATLGSAGASSGFFNFSGATPNTLYPAALADKVAGTDLEPGEDDITARFNSNLGGGGGCSLDFYYGFDANPPSGSDIDLVAVALHEIGHGLGFAAFFNVSSGAEQLGLDDVYELGLEQHGVGPLAPMTNAGRAAAAKDDGDLHFVGPTVTAAIGLLTGGVSGGHIQMYAPTTVQPGSSVSHFDTDVTPSELMEPSYTGPNHDPGLAVLLLCDLGWGPCGTCGDGIIDGNETCDDGNDDAGDGCSHLCQIEACNSCAGEPSICSPDLDGTPCTDGSACTQTDTCQSGACSGADPVVCSALDQCHDVGTCNPASGLCSNPAKPEGASCDDGESCTGPDQCNGGVCGGLPNCIDPFLCYRGKTSKLGGPFVPPPTVALADQFENLNVTVVKPKGLCTPAELNADPIVDTATHLENYPIRPITGQPKHVKRTAFIRNQIGTLTVQTQKPAFLLVPTNQSPSADPPLPAPTIEVDHYKCYSIKVATGTTKFPKNVTVTLANQFITAQTFAVKKPTHLCTPVDKNGEGIVNATVHQLCYLVKPTFKNPTHPGLFLHTQFGAERLDASKEERLCVPSLKTVL